MAAAARNLVGIVDAVRSAAPDARITAHAVPSDWSEAPLAAVGARSRNKSTPC